MNVEKMSEDGAVATVNEICDGLKNFVKHNPSDAKTLLAALIDGALDELSQDDFFGTEGWEVALGAA